MVIVVLAVTLIAVGVGGATYTAKKLNTIKTINGRRKEWAAADDFVMSVGAGGVSLVDLYLASDQHENALAALQHIYHNVIPDDASPVEWAAARGNLRQLFAKF